jgi:uncharacterized ion transporter superfamily protein YfcC
MSVSAKPAATGRFHSPTAYTILFALIIIIAGLTWIIPAGLYQADRVRVVVRDVPVAGTYALTDANPQGMSLGGWWMAEMSGLFLCAGIAIGLIGRFGE